MSVSDEKKSPTLPGSRRHSDVKTGQVIEPLSVGAHDDQLALDALGYKPELRRNRSMYTLLFQSLAIAAVCEPLYMFFSLSLDPLLTGWTARLRSPMASAAL